MNFYRLLILVVLIFGFTSLQSQSVAPTELDKLKDKSVLLMAPGVVFTVVGITLTGLGIHQFRLGSTWEGSVYSPELVDHRPEGRAFLCIGVPMLAGGLALLGSGIHFRTVYADKKAAVTLNAGYLENGAIGIAMKF